LLHEQLEFPTTPCASRPVNLVNEYANEPASWPAVPSAHHGGNKTGNPDPVLCLGRAQNLNARGLFQWSVVGSILGVGSIDWAHFTGKHLYFPNVLFVCQICTQILWNYIKFEAKNGHFSVVY
jgi:hypothetical protein